MAVEQSGAEASSGPAKPAGPAAQASDKPPASDLPDTAKAELEELKRKFRDALERKRGTHASAEGTQDTGKVHGSHGPETSRRTFRRKSGG
jgi:Family of unknown function (DUF5302)